ncbi:hypothetical protein DUNSADRAFT_7966 [Dunaliella salina]|uniref:Encoded protein n=1 Tax=Dunaliella salina TaxID=3046 RepID=A0ABQ7H624_DUNSA|nr:hypothetical protein DUNSADRAFT_7966 [Dunaliella salina]|eukprot:KAF5842313.1 hypothetical protein DUNSADRAFT_7966 [Dunaliella salina]
MRRALRQLLSGPLSPQAAEVAGFSGRAQEAPKALHNLASQAWGTWLPDDAFDGKHQHTQGRQMSLTPPLGLRSPMMRSQPCLSTFGAQGTYRRCIHAHTCPYRLLLGLVIDKKNCFCETAASLS